MCVYCREKLQINHFWELKGWRDPDYQQIVLDIKKEYHRDDKEKKTKYCHRGALDTRPVAKMLATALNVATFGLRHIDWRVSTGQRDSAVFYVFSDAVFPLKL